MIVISFIETKLLKKFVIPFFLISLVSLALVPLLGVEVKKGQMIQLITSTAGLDPNTYDDPDTFDIHRNHDKSISFGQGPHYCIGVTLVRSQTEVMLRELFNRFPNLSLTGDVQYDYDHHNARRMTELTVKTNI